MLNRTPLNFLTYFLLPWFQSVRIFFSSSKLKLGQLCR